MHVFAVCGKNTAYAMCSKYELFRHYVVFNLNCSVFAAFYRSVI